MPFFFFYIFYHDLCGFIVDSRDKRVSFIVDIPDLRNEVLEFAVKDTQTGLKVHKGCSSFALLWFFWSSVFFYSEHHLLRVTFLFRESLLCVFACSGQLKRTPVGYSTAETVRRKKRAHGTSSAILH